MCNPPEKPYLGRERDHVYAAIDGERTYQDARNPKVLTLGEELALAVKYAIQANGGQSDEPRAPQGFRRLAEVRKLAAVCVRALEHYGTSVRGMCVPHGMTLRPHEPGTRQEVYAAIDSELLYQREKKSWQHWLGEETAAAVACALEALGHWSNQPFDESELMARFTLRKLAAICVRALGRYGAPPRLPDPPPPPPRDRSAWKKGKTSHVIAFVEEAEASFSKTNIGYWADLRDRIEELKSGKETLEAPQTVAEGIEDYRRRCPH